MAANQRHKSSGRKSQAQPNGPAKRAASAMRELGDDASGYVSRGASQVRDLTKDHEGTAVVVALTAGFGVGLLIGAALAASHSRPETWRDRIAAEGLGRRMLERIESLLPDAVTDYVRT